MTPHAGQEESGPIALAIRRPVTVVVGVLLCFLFGFVAIGVLPIQLTPDIEVPTLTVTTRWPGAAPIEVEREVVVPQEKVLKSVVGLSRMISESKQDEAVITLEFNVSTGIDEALVRVANQLAQVTGLPELVREPVINTANTAGPPLAVLLLRGKDGRSAGPYRTWFENEVLPQIERVKGIAGVRYFGGRDEEVHFRFDPGKLAARGISVSQLGDAIRRELRDVSAGDLELGKRQFVVRTRITPEHIADFDQLHLGTGDDGQPIRFGDVGSAIVALGKQRSFVLSDGQESLALLLDREAGSNVLETTEQVRAVVAEVQADMLDEADLSLTIASDQTDYIYTALALVRNNLFLGGALAVLVLWTFLRSLRAALLVGLAIPTCVMGTMVGMAVMGRTINVVSLAGMAFAVGMVVDNAIVVIESIVTERQKGLPSHRAALVGAGNVWGAIVASTVTTVAVFSPILGWDGEVGQLLADIAVAITVAVILSLLVSVLAIPSLAARLPDAASAVAPPFLTRLDAPTAAARDALIGVVRRIVSGPVLSAVTAGTALVAALLAAFLLLPPAEYLPTGNRELILGFIVPPPGYSVSEMRDVGEQIQSRLIPHLGVDKDGVPAIGRTFFVGSPSNGFMGATAADPMRTRELVDYIRDVQKQVPGIFGFAFQSALFGRGAASGRAIEVEVSGPSLEDDIQIAGRLFGELQRAVPGAQVRPLPSLDLGGPELRVVANRKVATELGFSLDQLGNAVDAFVDGWRIGEYGDEGSVKRDVRLIAGTEGVGGPTELAGTPIATPHGPVPVGSLATLTETLSPLSIRHIERRRGITLELTPPNTTAVEAALNLIETQVLGPLRASGDLPPGVQVRLAGAADDLGDAQSRMAGVLLLALVISYLLMSALFEDFIAPLAILTAVPLAAVGGILGLRVVNLVVDQPFDMLTALGFVILIGVVVNNPILVVDGALQRLRDGVPLVEAIVQGVTDRVRPIFMTTLTTVAGLAPLVLVPGQGSELYKGIGAVVLGGLLLATALTLFVVPAIYGLLCRLRGIQ